MENAQNAQQGKSEVPDPESKKTPPEAKNSGPESSTSVPGPRKRYNATVKGAKELRCLQCNGFIGEVKGTVEWSRFLCHRCKSNSSFAFSS